MKLMLFICFDCATAPFGSLEYDDVTFVGDRCKRCGGELGGAADGA